MDTFNILSAFYMKDRDMLLVTVNGKDARFKRGAKFADAFGKVYEIAYLAEIGGISPENAAKFTGFLVKGDPKIGRLIRFMPE